MHSARESQGDCSSWNLDIVVTSAYRWRNFNEKSYMRMLLISPHSATFFSSSYALLFLIHVMRGCEKIRGYFARTISRRAPHSWSDIPGSPQGAGILLPRGYSIVAANPIESLKESTIAQVIWLWMTFSGTQLGGEINVALEPLGSVKLTAAKAGAAPVTGSCPVLGSKLTDRISLLVVTAAQAMEFLEFFRSFTSTGEAQPQLAHVPSLEGGAPRFNVAVVLVTGLKATPSIEVKEPVVFSPIAQMTAPEPSAGVAQLGSPS